MNRSFSLLAAAALGYGAAGPEIQLVFAPEVDLPVTKVLETSFEFALGEFDFQINGQSLGPLMMQSYRDRMDIEASSLLRFVDEYQAVRDGRPLALVREFESLLFEAESAAGLEISRHDAFLEGVALTFTWDAAKEEYSVAADIESLNLDDVSHGGEDMDLRTLLPGRPVRVGEAWRVTGADVLPVLWPGLRWDQARAALVETLERAALPVDVDAVFEAVVEAAAIDCRATGERETSAGKLQVVELDSDFELELDLSDSLLRVLRAMLDESVQAETSAKVRIQAGLSGELLWDPEAGRAASLRMDLDFSVSAELAAKLGEDEEGRKLLEGSLELEAFGGLGRRFTATAAR